MFICGSSAWRLSEVPCHAFAPWSIAVHGLLQPNLFLGKSFPQACKNLPPSCVKQSSLALIGQLWG